jgi:uncharacterized membrane protein YkoI
MATVRIAAAAALALGLVSAVPYQTRAADDDAARARAAVRAKEFVSLASILDWMEARYRGQAIEIELEDDPGETPVYEVEWLTPDGHVVDLEFDARDGRLLEWEGRGLDEAKR